MANFDLIGSLTPGFKLGSSLRRGFDERKQTALGAQQREVLGGLRRRSLGLGGATQEQAQEARLELLSADPVAAGKFFDNFSKLPTPEQDRLKEKNNKIGLAASNLIQVDDQQLPSALLQTAKAFANSGDEDSARRTLEMVPLAQENPNAVRQRLQALETQARDVEKVVASREKSALNKAKGTQKELDNDLKASKDQFEMTDKLRTRVDATSKEFVKVRDARNRLEAVFDTNKQARIIADFAKAAKNNPNAEQIAQSTEAFGDMALIFNFMKMLDPGSTVREGEFASAQNTGGVDDKIINLYNQALKGTRLNTSQRAGLRAQANGLFEKASKQNEKDLIKFRRTANKFNLDIAQIFDAEEIEDGALSADELAELEDLEAELGNR